MCGSFHPVVLVHDAFKGGKLAPNLPGYEAVALGIFAVYVSHRKLPLKLYYLKLAI